MKDLKQKNNYILFANYANKILYALIICSTFSACQHFKNTKKKEITILPIKEIPKAKAKVSPVIVNNITKKQEKTQEVKPIVKRVVIKKGAKTEVKTQNYSAPKNEKPPVVTFIPIQKNYFEEMKYDALLNYHDFKYSDQRLWDYCKTANLYYSIYKEKFEKNANQEDINLTYLKHKKEAEKAIKFYEIIRGE